MSDNRNPRFADFEQYLTQCPACGSFDHDGWTNHQDCPEDWAVYSKFEARRWVQLTCERYNEEVGVTEVSTNHQEKP